VGVAAKLVSKGQEAKYIPARAVWEGLAALCDGKETSAKDVANATRLQKCLLLLVGSAEALANVECLFARDWTVDGAPFRTTWAAGWALSLRNRAFPLS